MAAELSAPPVLSTPAENTFDLDPSPAAAVERPPRTDEELAEVYEIARTAAEIADQGWRRVALQFPDAMLGDAPWVVEALKKALADLPVTTTHRRAKAPADTLETDVAAQSKAETQAPSRSKGPGAMSWPTRRTARAVSMRLPPNTPMPKRSSTTGAPVLALPPTYPSSTFLRARSWTTRP